MIYSVALCIFFISIAVFLLSFAGIVFYPIVFAVIAAVAAIVCAIILVAGNAGQRIS